MNNIKAQIISEIDVRNENAQLIQAIQELRSELTDLYLTVRKYREKGSK